MVAIGEAKGFMAGKEREGDAMKWNQPLKEYNVGGIKMKISEIEQIRHTEGAVLGRPGSPTKKGSRGKTAPGRVDRARFLRHAGKLLGGMSPQAHDTFMK